MRNGAVPKVVILGLLAFALVPGVASAAGQGQDLSEMLASNAAAQATAVSGPIISVSPLALDYGVVNNGSTSALMLNIANIGDQTLNVISMMYSDGAYSSPMLGNIAAGTSQNVSVSFHPVDGLAHPGTLTISSNASNGAAIVLLTGQGNSAPTLNAIGNKTAGAFTALNFMVTGTDAADTVDDLLTFSMGPGLPPGATFDGTTGAFSWTPSAADAGNHSVAFSVSDGRLSDSETINIAVSVTNRPPVANAGGNYFGATGRPLQFNAGGSSDPDAGQTLTYSWDFGDGATGSGVNPQHTYAIPGNFIAGLVVCDNGVPQLCDDDFAAITIQTEIGAQIILKNNGNILETRLPFFSTKIGIEEILLPYTDLIPSSIKISTDRPNAGTVTQCSVDSRTALFGDMDADGVTDFDVFFRNWCLFLMFLKTPDHTIANLIITGDFATPGGGTTPLRAVRSAEIRTWGFHFAPVLAVAYPNPFNPETAIAYTLKGDGPVSMRIYSVSGRLIRTLKEGENTNAGAYSVRWNGTDNHGRHVPSGIYFVKTSQRTGGTEESSVLKVTLMK
jgi:hypothetical protein